MNLNLKGDTMYVKTKIDKFALKGLDGIGALPVGSVVEINDEEAALKHVNAGLLEVFDLEKHNREEAELKKFEDNQLKSMAQEAEKSARNEIYKELGLDPEAKDFQTKLDALNKQSDDLEAKKGKSGFDSFGQQFQAIAKALGMNFETKDPTGQGELVPADGGYLVDTEFDTVLNNRMMETSLLAGRANSRTIGVNYNSMKWNNVINYDRTDGNHPSTVYYTEEADAITDSKVTFEQIELALLKLAGLNYLTGEIIQDTANLEEEIIDIFANEFGWKIDNGIFEGAGGTAMTGILGHTSNVAVARNTASQVNVEDVTAMYSRLYTRSKANAVWFVNPDVVPSLQSFQIGDQPVYTPPGGFSTSPYGSLFGRPIIELEHCKTTGTLGDINLWDLSQYRVIEKGGISVARSEDVRFVNDEVALRFIKRANGIPMWTSVQTPQNGSNTVSPFVSLAT